MEKASTQTETCPSCFGEKIMTVTGIRYASGFRGPLTQELPCSICDGVGKISRGKLLRVKRGESFRRYRVEALGMGLREAAEKWGMRPSELSYIEQGRVVRDWEPPGWRPSE